MQTKPFDCDDITLDNWEGFKSIRKKRLAQACQIHFLEGFRVTTPRGVELGEPGDYLVIGTDGKKRLLRQEVFEADYVVVKHDIAKVQAVYDDGGEFSIDGFWPTGFDVTLRRGITEEEVFAETFREALKALIELADKHSLKGAEVVDVQVS